MGNAVRFRQPSVGRQKGELARLKVVQGPDYGSVYIINGMRVTVGRGEENDIVISDLKASRLHAEFTAQGGAWQVKDLGSANGILVNGKQSRGSRVQSNDTITLGETTLEFMASEAATQLLLAPAKSIAEVQSQQAALQAQKQKVKNLGAWGGVAGTGTSIGIGAPKASAKSPPKPLLIVGAVVVLFGVYVMMDDPPAKPPAAAKKDGAERDLASYLPAVDPEAARTADQFFRTGFREYLDHNYLRAQIQFETVLQIAPAHHLAMIYLENCKSRIKEDVKKYLELGRRHFDAGKLREARGDYEEVLRLLYREPTSPDYTGAKEQLDRVIAAIKQEDRSS